LRHAGENEGVSGFCHFFFGFAQEGEGELVALGKTFVGCLTVGADAEYHNAALDKLQNIVPVIPQLGSTDRGIVTEVKDDEYIFPIRSGLATI